MVGGLCALATSSYIGRLADKHGKFKIFSICLVISLIPIFIITDMPLIPFYAVLSVFGFWFTLFYRAEYSRPGHDQHGCRSCATRQFMSFNSSFQQLFTGAASIISGLIVTQDAQGRILNYNWVGYLSVAVVFSTLFLGETVG